MNKPNDSEPREENPYQAQPAKKSSNSCCIYGCLGMVLLTVLVTVGVGFSGYWWLKGQVNRYTADTAADLPIVELPEEQLVEIRGRADKFKETIEAGETPEDLVLTAEELNALITQDDDLRGRVYVTIEDGQVSGDVSIPTDSLPGGKGRFFNASATFDVSLENGVLIVTLADAEVKGEKIPQQFIDGMSKENLAKDVYKDPEVAATLRRIESISIEQDKIILKPHVHTEESHTEHTDTDAELPAADETPQSTEPGEPGGVEAAPADDPSAATEGE